MDSTMFLNRMTFTIMYPTVMFCSDFAQNQFLFLIDVITSTFTYKKKTAQQSFLKTSVKHL